MICSLIFEDRVLQYWEMSLFFSFNPCAFQKKSFSLIFLICTYLDFPNDLDFASLFF